MTAAVDRKIVRPETLAQALRAARDGGQTVVQCHGCFDIVHPGHVRYLRFARELGDLLVVSLTGDSVMNKGPSRPYIPQELRAENLAALEFVDWVVIDPHPTAAELLELLRPDVYVKGREYAQTVDPRFRREQEIVEGYGGRVVFHSGDVVFSSTRLLESMVGDAALDEHRLRTLCARSDIDGPAVAHTMEALGTLRVLVVGDLIQEHSVFCDAGAVAEDAPVLALRRLGARESWGGAAALAQQFQALGAAVQLVTAQGRDSSARELREGCAGAGLTAHLLSERPATVQRTTFIADDGQLFQLTEGESAPLDSAAEKRTAGLICDLLAGANVLAWSEHGFGLLTPGLLRMVNAEARRRGCVIVGHAPGPGGSLLGLRHTSLLTATERQVREALHDMNSGLPAVVWNLLSANRGRALLVSLRKRGVIGFEDRASPGLAGGTSETSPRSERLQSEFVPSPARHFLDWHGAAEALLATATGVVAVGGALPLAAYIAAAAETLSVSRYGGQPVTAAELSAWFFTRPELRAQNRFLPDCATIGDIALLAPPLA